MKSCSITFKIKDFFPKIDTIPFDEYACLFMSGDYNEKIPLIEKIIMFANIKYIMLIQILNIKFI